MKGKNGVTINDIAQKLGLAKSTVSNVFTGRKFVSEEIRSKVLKTCEEINYYPSFMASRLITKKTNIIGLFLETARGYQDYYSELIKAILEAVSVSKYQLLLFYGESSENIVAKLGRGRAPIDGAILLSPQLSDRRVTKFCKDNIPFVVIGRVNISPMEGLHFDQVDIDNKLLVGQVSQHLIELGHREIAFLNSRKSLTISEDRKQGYKTALEECGCAVFDEGIYFSTESSEDEGYRIAGGILKNRPGVTAFITANDILAAGVYRAAKENGIKIGKGGVSVFALGGNNYAGEKFVPPLSCAKQNYSELALMAATMLLKQINSEDSAEPQISFVASELSYTESVSKL